MEQGELEVGEGAAVAGGGGGSGLTMTATQGGDYGGRGSCPVILADIFKASIARLYPAYSRVQEDDPLRRPLPTACIRPLHPPWSVPAVSDMVREALLRDTRDGREGDEHQGEEFHKGYEGGGQEVLVVVPPAMGMGILSILVRDGEGAGIVSKEDVQIVAVRRQ